MSTPADLQSHPGLRPRERARSKRAELDRAVRGETDAGIRHGPGAGAMALLFGAALALRLVYLHQLEGSPLGQVLLGDGLAYEAWARRILSGSEAAREVYYQAPLYPHFLALVHWLAGASLHAVRVAQALLGAASCLLVAGAGARWFDARSGLAAGWLIALYPPALFFDGEIQKASLSLFLMAALLLLVAALRRERPPWLALAAGAVAGLFALNRENALLLIPLLAGWLALAPGSPTRRRLLPAALLVVGALAALAPVALRNRAIGGELLLTTSQLGTNFYIGNHAGADGRYRPLRPGRGSARFEREDATALAVAAAGRPLSPAEVSRHWLGRALEFIRAEPGAWLRLLGHKWLLVWNAREIVDTTSIEAAADVSPLLRALGRLLGFGVLCPLAAAGLWLTRGRFRELGILHAVLLAWALSVAAFFVFARYRHPMVPILALFAGAALVEGLAALRARRFGALAAAATLAGMVALLVHRPLDERDPRAVTYASLGGALDDAGRSAEAAAYLERAVALSPRFAEAHRALAHLRLGRGELDAAEAGYRRAVELDPGDAEAWNNLGVIAARRGHLPQALGCFRLAVVADGGHVSARFNLARTLLEIGDRAAARAEARRFVELAPGDAAGRELLRALDAEAAERP